MIRELRAMRDIIHAQRLTSMDFTVFVLCFAVCATGFTFAAAAMP